MSEWWKGDLACLYSSGIQKACGSCNLGLSWDWAWRSSMADERHGQGATRKVEGVRGQRCHRRHFFRGLGLLLCFGLLACRLLAYICCTACSHVHEWIFVLFFEKDTYSQHVWLPMIVWTNKHILDDYWHTNTHTRRPLQNLWGTQVWQSLWIPPSPCD